MSTTITAALSGFTAMTNSTLAASVGGATWTDVLINFFYDWKWWAAIISTVVICTAGIFALGKTRLVGILLIIGGVFCGIFFANIEDFIKISQNTEQKWQKPATHSNPFNRT